MNPLWLLLLLALVAGGAVWWFRRDAAPARPEGLVAPVDELSALGLTPARPRDADAGDAPAIPTPTASRPHAPAPPAAPEPGSVIRDARAWGPHHGALAPLLETFAATVGGPVAVLSTADGVASVDALAEADAAPRLPQRRLSAERTDALADGADDAFAPSEAAGDALRALRAVSALNPPAAAVRRLGPDSLLVVGGTLSDATLHIADRFADLLAAFIADEVADAPLQPEADEQAEADQAAAPIVPLHPETHDEPALELVDLDAETTDDGSRTAPAEHAHPRPRPVETAPVPRAVLLAAEIASAREAGRPLAFALVTRADAEAALADGDADTVTTALGAEIALADPVRRAEPFGDLVVGAFIDADADGARAWAETLEDGAFRVGLVAPADYDAEALRADAEEARRRR